MPVEAAIHYGVHDWSSRTQWLLLCLLKETSFPACTKLSASTETMPGSQIED